MFIEPEKVKGHVYYRLREGRKVIQYIGNDAKLQVFLRDHPQIKYVVKKEGDKNMPGTSKISTYVGFRCPNELFAAMNSIIKTYNPPIPISQWMIPVLTEAVKKKVINNGWR